MERKQTAFKESTLELSLSFDESLLVSHNNSSTEFNTFCEICQAVSHKKKWNLLCGIYVKALLHKMSTDSLEVIS